MPGITLVNPGDARRFVAGHPIVIARPPWWLRLLRWMRLARRRPAMAVVKVDYDKGEITVSCAGEPTSAPEGR